MTKNEALKMAINFIEEITNAAGKYPYVDKTQLVSDSYQMASKLKEALEQPTVAKLNDEYLRDTYVEGLNQPAQEPQYLYVYKSENNRKIHFSTGKENNVLLEYIGKIKLEVDDD